VAIGKDGTKLVASLITANRGVATPVLLDGVGFRHGQKFVVYAEAVDYRDLDAAEFGEGALLHCEAVRLDGEQSGWWSEVGSEHVPKFSERKESGFQVVWRTRLNPGQWRVVLRINGRVVAQREVEILELFL
jgi:hypothetical protein